MDNITRIHEIAAYQAQHRPEGLALIDIDGRQVSWAEFDRLISNAETLLRDKEVGAGDRVLIVAENSLALPVLMLAASRIGAWAVPVNARMSGPEIARITAHARPAVVFYTSGISREAAEHATNASSQQIETAFGSLHLCVTAIKDPETEVGAPVAVLLYTTGTTGDPKGVMLTHDNLIFAGRTSAELRQLGPQDRVYGALPLTHVFGVASMMVASAWAGCSVQLARRFAPAALYEALRNGVTVLQAVPQMHALLMAYATDHGIARLEGHHLRYVSSGAAPLDPVWKRKAEEFYGVALQNGYGMTETTAGVSGSLNKLGDPDISTGRPLPGVEVRLDHSVGQDPGTGEIQTRGPHIMKGYFRNPEATRAIFTDDGFLRTGDLGRLDDQGRLSIVGRTKELIIRGGFNVYPPEVEAALNAHPDVVQSAVIGHNVQGDETVLAFVEVQRPVAPEDLKSFAASRLAGYKRPEQIYIIDRLPAAATGKILKHRLAVEFADLFDPAS